jgi:cytoskeleton protein RodZ
MADSLGARLRQKREALGLGLADVEGRIRIRAKHLQAIESDDLSAFSSSAQAKGFIRTYALFLDVPFESATHPIGAAGPTPPAPMVVLPPPPDPSATVPVKRHVPYDGMPKPVSGPRRALTRWLRMEVIVIGMAGFMVLGLFAWGINTMILSSAATPVPTAMITPATSESPIAASGTATDSANASAAATPTALPTLNPGVPSTPKPTLYPTPEGGVYTTVHLRILVKQSAFLKVEVDGAVAFAQRVMDGDSFEFDGKRLITISTGNGAAIQVFYNGIDQGILGIFGEIVIRTWNLSGQVQVTPTALPTPTATPAIVRSPSPTP